MWRWLGRPEDKVRLFLEYLDEFNFGEFDREGRKARLDSEWRELWLELREQEQERG